MDLLTGITVLDFSRVLSGPYCTMLLGDYGADVLKVERPGAGGGDETRAWGPPFFGGESAYYLAINRNKRALTLDLKHDAGRDLARKLAARSDILVENFTPGAMARLGLDYDSLRASNPRLIYCSISGFGQDGPDAAQPGFDLVLQARAGLQSLTGPADGPPSIVGVAVVDLFAAQHALALILAALHARERTGAGCRLDVGLLDAGVSMLIHRATAHLMSGQPPVRHGNAHPNIVPYQTFRAADGYINIAAGNDRLYANLCHVLKREDLARDARFATNALRVAHRAELLAELEPLIAARTAAALNADLTAAHVPAAVVQDLGAVFRDPQVLARELLAEVAHPACGDVRMPGTVGRVNGAKPPVRRPPPRLGEHTFEILNEKLGLDEARLKALRREGAI
ncbi:MAG: CoA transferase [Planctomycetota bacterium]|nr:CoA transferase [Planctomycetota bacterium]